MKKIISITLALLCFESMEAQKITFFSPTVVRVEKTTDGQFAEKKSLVITATPQKVAVSVKQADGKTVYRTNALTVTVDDKSQQVSFAKADGTMLMTEGDFAFTPITEGIDKGSYRVKQAFALEKDEPIYGLGMMQSGKMNLRGEHRLMIQTNLEDFTHFFQSIKGYGIYWDNYSPTTINDDDTLQLESQVGKAVDYYFMYGNDADGVIRQMRWLSGKVPMVPRWTYGFHQSRERYKSANELLDVVRRYRKMGIPFDGIIQDWQYWGGNYNWNAMEFLNDAFSNPQAMIDEVHQRHAHLTISVWASFGPHTKPYRELDEKGLLFHFKTWPESGLTQWPPRQDYPSGVRVYDCYSPVARDIYWKYLSKLHQMGIDAWWMDSTDPDHCQFKDSDLDEKCSMGSWRSVRNAFAMMAVGGVDQNQRKADSIHRPFILTRSFFAGQQRYGAHTWSGDVGSSWQSFRAQVPLCLNHTLCANPNVNTDIGGFFANAYNRTYLDNTGTTNPQFQELYVRWMQFGLFTPMMRSHGTEVYRELYYYGKPGEPVYDALLDAVKMRYRLLPYIYSQSWQVSANDDSFMRPLVMDFRNDKNVWNNGRQYMFGHSFLVCPVLDPLFTEEKIVKTDEQSGWDRHDNNEYANGWPTVDWSQKKQFDVYLPQGADWYDFWTGKLYNGGQTIKADAPIAHSPLYVKAGSIVPMGDDRQYSDERPWDVLTLLVYPGCDASFTLYEDEGDNFNYQRGQYAEIPMTWNEKQHLLTIGQRRGKFKGMLQKRVFEVKMPDNTIYKVAYNGKKTTVKIKR